jgi:hypothetical protein
MAMLFKTTPARLRPPPARLRPPPCSAEATPLLPVTAAAFP